MPNYITHAVMGEVTEIPNHRIEISKELCRFYSLGPDLLFSSRGMIEKTHNISTRNFFLSITNQIIKGKLWEDPSAMAFLYGQIMHYSLDKTAHPFIFYITNDVPRSSLVNFHMAAEEYLGNFILHKKLNLSRKDIHASYYTGLKKTTPETETMIDNAYEEIYQEFGAYETMEKSSISYLKMLDNLTHTLDSLNPSFYLKLIGLDGYLKKTHIKEENLANENHDLWYDPITQKHHQESFLELFDQSISTAQESMEKVDSVIYENEPISTLDTVFDDTSYDTGLDCSIGKPFVRSKVKDLLKTRR